MKRELDEPERWSDRAADPAAIRRFRAPAEDQVGALFRRVREATVARALDVPGARGPARARGRVGRLLRPLALAAAVVVASGGVVKAARAVWRVVVAEPQSLIVPSGSSAVLHRRGHRRLTVSGPARLEIDQGGLDRVDATLDGGSLTAESGEQALLVRAGGLDVTLPPGASARLAGRGAGTVDALEGELRVLPAGSTAPIALSAGHRWPEPIAPVAPVPAQPSPAPAAPAGEGIARPRAEAAPGRAARNGAERADSEAAWVARAFQALRVDGDAHAALRALDQRARRFPNGALSDEARVARVEALLALGRSSDALPLLLEMRDRSQGLTRDIQAARAEILAERDRCAEASADFDDLLASPARDQAAERALYGRAGCRLRAGETARARQDLLRYLDVYPQGRFSDAVHRAVHDLEPGAAP